MSWQSILWGGLVAGIILFLWSGLSQMFPWGVPSANVVFSQTVLDAAAYQVTDFTEYAPGDLTTSKFDDEFSGKVSTLVTDKTFSWIVSQPVERNSIPGYFSREFLTQLLVGLLLSLLFMVIQPSSGLQGAGIAALIGLVAVVATYGQLYNWWGLTIPYALGVSANIIVGWAIVGFVLAHFIIPNAG